MWKMVKIVESVCMSHVRVHGKANITKCDKSPLPNVRLFILAIVLTIYVCRHFTNAPFIHWLVHSFILTGRAKEWWQRWESREREMHKHTANISLNYIEKRQIYFTYFFLRFQSFPNFSLLSISSFSSSSEYFSPIYYFSSSVLASLHLYIFLFDESHRISPKYQPKSSISAIRKM